MTAHVNIKINCGFACPAIRWGGERKAACKKN